MRALLVFLCIISFSPAWAQSSNEQLSALVAKLQQSPEDNALRGQIIKLAQKEKPAVPENARAHFVEGTAIAQSAKDAKAQKLAVASFKEALKIAPWWGDAYYNLAVAQELSGQFNDAQSSLEFYILTNPGEKEAREAQDRIYALKGKKKVAEAEAATQAEKTAQKKAEAEKEKAKPPPEQDMRYTCRDAYVTWTLFTSEASKNVVLTFTASGEVFAGGPVTADFTADKVSWGASWQNRQSLDLGMPLIYMRYEFNRPSRTLYWSYNNGANGEGTLSCTVG